MQSEIKRRQEKLKHIAERTYTSRTDQKTINTLIQTQNGLFWGARLAVLIGFGVLRQRKIFEKKSRFFWKEAGAFCSGVFFVAGMDYLVSEAIWRYSGDIIHRNSPLVVEGENFARMREDNKKTQSMTNIKK
jgi:hypothetical protein